MMRGDGRRPSRGQRDDNDITARNTKPDSNNNTKKILLPIPSPRPKSVMKKKGLWSRAEATPPPEDMSKAETPPHLRHNLSPSVCPQALSVPSVPVDTRFTASRV